MEQATGNSVSDSRSVSQSAASTGAGPAQSADSLDLPDEPIVTIEAGRGWTGVSFRDLWAYRELLYFLTWRDLKVRYKQTMLGATWAILQPLVMMIIFTYFFGKLARVNTEGVPYPVFYYTGVTVWTYFSNSILSGANSLIGNTNLITKVYFPRYIVPAAAVAAGLVDYAIASILLVGLLIYYRVPVTLAYLMLIPLVLVVTLLALGVSALLAAMNVKYRDVRYALPFLIQVWMFVSPIIYPASLVPDEWRWLLSINPMTGIVECFRSALFGSPLRWGAFAYSVAFTFAVLVYSMFVFKRTERHFAEYI